MSPLPIYRKPFFYFFYFNHHLPIFFLCSYIPTDGIYNVYIDTPGCVGTSSCDQRTQVQLDINLTPGNTSIATLNQNIISDQRTLIYTGSISATSDTFKPSIVMKISPTAQASSVSSILVFGSAIEFDRNTTALPLSNILQYFPSNGTWSALKAQMPVNSVVRTLQTDGNQLYVGGQFNFNNTIANIASYNTTHAFQPLSNGGLNGQVTTSLLLGSSKHEKNNENIYTHVFLYRPCIRWWF